MSGEDLHFEAELDQFHAALQAATQDGWSTTVELDVVGAYALIAVVQLALKHPQNNGPTADLVAGFAIELQSRLPATLKRLSEQGWPEGRCRVCGCTDERACEDANIGGPCYWVEPNLCSACAGEDTEG